MIGTSQKMAAGARKSRTVLLLQPQTSGGINDLSATNKTLTPVGNPAISDALGYKTLYLNGQGSYLIIPQSDDFDTYIPFTLELFWRRTANTDCMLWQHGGGSDGWADKDGMAFLIFIWGNTIYVQTKSQYNSGAPLSHIATAPEPNYNHYISVSYDGGTLQTHVNTTRIGNTVGVQLKVPEKRDMMKIGSHRPFTTTRDLVGHIIAARFTAGAALNTGSTIAVPSLPFPVT